MEEGDESSPVGLRMRLHFRIFSLFGQVEKISLDFTLHCLMCEGEPACPLARVARARSSLFSCVRERNKDHLIITALNLAY